MISACPFCGSEKIHRSRTKTAMEKTLRSAFPMRYYRCHSCGWRGPRVRSESIIAYLGVYVISLLVLFYLMPIIVAKIVLLMPHS